MTYDSTESEGIVIAYTSVYGNTKKAVELLAEKLTANGCPKVVLNDLAREDMAECVEDCKDITYTETTVKILSTMNDESKAQIDALVEELTKDSVSDK